MASVAEKAVMAWDMTHSFSETWWCVLNQVLMSFKWLVNSFTGTSDMTPSV